MRSYRTWLSRYRKLTTWLIALVSLVLVLTGAMISTPRVRGSVATGNGSSLLARWSGQQSGDWNGWAHDLLGTRFNPAEHSIDPQTATHLKLKWSFVFPNVLDGTSSQPTVVGDTLYVGSWAGILYALNARTGAVKWSFDVKPISGSGTGGIPNRLRDSPLVVGNKVIFGDGAGYMFALNRFSGKLIWDTRLSNHPFAIITGSPVAYAGRVYVGVSSNEELAAEDTTYPCCTFRGQFDALDLSTGAVDWQYYTVPPAKQIGVTKKGIPRYAPSGGAIWSTPVIDPLTGTVYFGTGNNYTGTAGHTDSVIALDATTGALRWKRQMTHPDDFTVGCVAPGHPHCPGQWNGTARDWDFGSSPNIFFGDGRVLVGEGEKSGTYYAFDAGTGDLVWQRQLSEPEPDGGQSGIEWGTSYDGRYLYVATWKAGPGTMFALDPAKGDVVWSAPNPADGCTTGGAAGNPACSLSLMPAVTSTPGLVYEGSGDGKFRIYRSSDGAVLWQYDTARQFTGTNGATGSGGAVSGNGGAVVSHGMVYVESGYPLYGIPGRVLMAFGL